MLPLFLLFDWTLPTLRDLSKDHSNQFCCIDAPQVSPHPLFPTRGKLSVATAERSHAVSPKHSCCVPGAHWDSEKKTAHSWSPLLKTFVYFLFVVQKISWIYLKAAAIYFWNSPRASSSCHWHGRRSHSSYWQDKTKAEISTVRSLNSSPWRASAPRRGGPAPLAHSPADGV